MRAAALWSESLLKSTGGPLEDKGSRTPSQPAEPVEEDKLTPRSMHDSYSELVLPFASSVQVLEEYINASGGIRSGKLMENFDSLAGSIAYKHMLGPSVKSVGSIEDRGFYIVTASVDRHAFSP
ncbi:hypothetical protein EST38_g7214 [Candolleomyces aberdarensis]|uniref:Uncharacterized protein n=1 Tax=Candolleomyces aberdarensis TaxID=2316362 RepID=A0A4Q2DFV1_9AGAR|nr:hypothetical protein EST38_g7214 [Candolleomyces aberdarensis]